MPNPVKAKTKRCRAIYNRRVIKSTNHTPFAPQALLENLGKSVNMSKDGDGRESLVDTNEDFGELPEQVSDDSADYIYSERKNRYGAQEDRPTAPDLFTSPPPIRDFVKTETSVKQDYTVQECLPFLAGLKGCGRSLFDYNEHGVPRLDRDRHVRYLHDSFDELPAGFVAFDASRPWLIYWALTGLSILGEDVGQYRQRWDIRRS